jgi:hypothetical protein
MPLEKESSETGLAVHAVGACAGKRADIGRMAAATLGQLGDMSPENQ